MSLTLVCDSVVLCDDLGGLPVGRALLHLLGPADLMKEIVLLGFAVHVTMNGRVTVLALFFFSYAREQLNCHS